MGQHHQCNNMHMLQQATLGAPCLQHLWHTAGDTRQFGTP
jgi:hypothetical protein